MNKCNVIYVVQIVRKTDDDTYTRYCQKSGDVKTQICGDFAVMACKTIAKVVCFLHPSDNMGIMQMFCMHCITFLSKL